MHLCVLGRMSRRLLDPPEGRTFNQRELSLTAQSKCRSVDSISAEGVSQYEDRAVRSSAVPLQLAAEVLRVRACRGRRAYKIFGSCSCFSSFVSLSRATSRHRRKLRKGVIREADSEQKVRGVPWAQGPPLGCDVCSTPQFCTV